MKCKYCGNLMGIMIGGARICSCGYCSVDGVTIETISPNGDTHTAKLNSQSD